MEEIEEIEETEEIEEIEVWKIEVWKCFRGGSVSFWRFCSV